MKMEEARKQLENPPEDHEVEILEDRGNFIAAKITVKGKAIRVNFTEENGEAVRHIIG